LNPSKSSVWLPLNSYVIKQEKRSRGKTKKMRPSNVAGDDRHLPFVASGKYTVAAVSRVLTLLYF